MNRFKFCIFDRLNTTLIPLQYTRFQLWIALNFVSLTDWIQLCFYASHIGLVVNRFKFCIFDRLNTTILDSVRSSLRLWIALNFVSLTDWIQHYLLCCSIELVVNRFKFCIFDRLNTTSYQLVVFLHQLWIALNFVSLTDWIQLFHFFYF